MINLAQEAPRSLSDVAELLGCHPSTVRRWANNGHEGAVLETVRIGGKRFTSLEALQRFSGCASVTATAPAPEKTRSANAAEELKRHGF